ncbi:WXG100 family type VII secretion target [Streptomyces marispadix]|uniref:WXG100 family type VII secretion target n=1 Tax=Streptomyces marispadix TaxID=2922868 RepID=A0ABS9SWA0_9ACTN|nr:WXG100 family type VII secretion target [Streptomyces marispadix]MCH6160550.1 WXG100 family type VII secretion target [Streptomyces marispadix]
MGDEAGLSNFTDTGNMCYMGEVKTPFATGEDIDSMKAMLADANPGQVLDVADAWQNIHKHLTDTVKTDFDKAVDHILQHWEGESADEFAKRAKQISKQITDCATYATRTSTVMRNVGHKLSEIKPKVDAIEKPSGFGSAMDKIGDGFSRDDTKWKAEIQGNQGAQKALDNHDGDLSAGKEEQLKAAAHMEELALTYTSQAKTMGSWNKKPPPRNHGEDYPGDPGGVAPVPIAVTPDDGGPGAVAAGASRTSSSVGRTTPKSTSPAASGTPASATKVDGVSGGTATTPRPGGASSGAPAGGVSGGGPAAGTGPGMGGVPGGPGYVGQAGAGRGAAGLGARAGRGVGGRVPAGLGAGGAGGAGGAAGKGVGAAAGRGPLARSRGGVLDTPQQGKGAAKQGGQGLHSSRGGTQAGARGKTGGVMGHGAAGNNSRRKEGENRQGERPDYLVEDEETWMPERRDVAPPSIG